MVKTQYNTSSQWWQVFGKWTDLRSSVGLLSFPNFMHSQLPFAWKKRKRMESPLLSANMIVLLVKILKKVVKQSCKFFSDHESAVTEIYVIDRIIVHPNFTRSETIKGFFINDIALVHTSTAIAFNRNVNPVCLPFNTEDPWLNYIDVDLVGKSWIWEKVSFTFSDFQAGEEVLKTVRPRKFCKN